MGRSRIDKDDRYRLMRTPPYSGLKLKSGEFVVVIPNPNELDCPDCLFCIHCTNGMSIDSKQVPCEARPDKLQCVYKIVEIINQPASPMDTDYTDADSSSTGD